ncbi:molybdate ABC transporter ATP-binding protein ModF [Catenovulum adriaticum]|uniref:Molybdate ABC transporter ATP-binding protein ModF n=1 Tax=Catenovulum adriaticum TaxID=2984846 RepID=A0ABY7AMY2_9ALTE|nr:molybdate ABC transporter ATP-binding protein ModF [Catenovulum sp. TS8]WAJ70077.1 molybdate ABC transporter ATP-binding protein ModF [Catenovulum sp. TS8]
MSNHLISLNQVCAQVYQDYLMSDLNWQIEQNQHWVLLGGNSSGKSALSQIILGQAEIISGELTRHTKQLACISFEQQQALIEAELKKDDADILDVIAEGTQVETILFEPNANQPLDLDLADKLTQDFEFSPLLKRKFRDLSTGETRKLLLIKAFINCPDLMVLDEPFDGLDAKSAQQLQQTLTELSGKISMVFILNRVDEIPDFITHYAYLKAGQIEFSFAKSNQAAYEQLMQLLHLQTATLTIPPADAPVSYSINPKQALVKLTQAKVVYDEKVIFDKLNWQIMPNQHWQLTGKNGSGKTCLLNLITGDNPQCYQNDIWLFGFQRGSGESIWQIKQHIGFISNQFHLNYRVSISALNTIISGFYDSIGLYNQPTRNQQKIAKLWLELLALSDKQDTPFNQLSFGDQRLLLIARSMVKHPPLLILDEPCIGLDEINRQRVLALIEKICTSGTTTVIYVNHHAQDKIQGINQFLAMEDYQSY